jgi:hypothetical protein
VTGGDPAAPDASCVAGLAPIQHGCDQSTLVWRRSVDPAMRFNGWKQAVRPVRGWGRAPGGRRAGNAEAGRVGRLGPSSSRRSRFWRSEMPANLLKGKRHNFRDFSERALIDHANQSDFDSAIPRFESWRPSQPTRSLPDDYLNSAKSRHFRRLAARSLVSGEEFRASRTDGPEAHGASLLAEFSLRVQACGDRLCFRRGRFEPSQALDEILTRWTARTENIHQPTPCAPWPRLIAH